jgi:hypothetical protein
MRFTATVELAIRDLKDGAGLEHCPSGHFFANASSGLNNARRTATVVVGAVAVSMSLPPASAGADSQGPVNSRHH